MDVFQGRAVGGALDRDEARRALALLADPAGHFELRPLPMPWQPSCLPGSDRDGLLEAAALAEAAGKTVYHVLNPVRPGSHSANDSEVTHRRWLFIDIDPVRAPGHEKDSATDREKALAAAVQCKIADWLADQYWPAPLQVDSGNGYYLLYRIDLPNDEHAKALVKRFLARLGERFDSDSTALDRKVYNASRLAKLPGSKARKGENTAERPHRVCRLMYAPESPEVVPVEAIQAVAGTAAAEASARNPFAGRAGSGKGYGKAALERECWRVVSAIPGPAEGRNNALFKAAAALSELVAGGELGREEVVAALSRAAGLAGLAGQEVPRTIESGFKHGSQNPRSAPPRHEANGAQQNGVPHGQAPGEEAPVTYTAATVKPRKVEWLWPRRIPMRKLTTVAGIMGIGKAQPLTSKVLTPNGWRRMGDISLGDAVVNPTGGLASVIGVFPQGVKEVYEVEFSDGAVARCCLEHLWHVTTPQQRYEGRNGRVLSLQQILSRGLRDAQGNSRFFIPLTSPVEYAPTDRVLEVDPYLLGLLLGDGCLSQNVVLFCSADDELIRAAAETVAPLGLSARRRNKYDWCLAGRKGAPNPLTQALRRLNLMGRRAEAKAVPREYLSAGPDDRLALLQGLFDTDGSAVGTYGVEFVSVSAQLARDVRELVQSLGGTAKISDKETTYAHRGEKRRGQRAYRVYARLPSGMPVFRLERKIARYRPGGKYEPARSIAAVRPAGHEECQCLLLDSGNRLYVTDDYVVTHNSFLLCDVASRVSAGMAWPDRPDERQEPADVLFISGEDDPDDTLVPRLIECGADLNRVRFLSLDALMNFTLASLQTLDQAARECRGRLRLVLIDPPSSYLGDVDDHKNAELRRVLTPLKHWCAEQHSVVLFNTHLNKGGAGKVEAIFRVIGGIAWMAAVRAGHVVALDPEDEERRLFVPMKSNLGKKPNALAYTIEELPDELARVRWLGEVDVTAEQAVNHQPKRTRKVVAREWLIERFKEKLEWESDELFKAGSAAGVSRNAVFEAKATLDLPKARKEVKESGDVVWVWWVPDTWPHLGCDPF